jgi:predicted methyltransferase
VIREGTGAGLLKADGAAERYMSQQVILSRRQVRPLLEAQQRGEGVAITSLDLGLSEAEVVIRSDHIVLAPGITLSLDVVREIAQGQKACFLVEEAGVRTIQRFSEHTNLFYSLLPTDSAPTLMVSGIPMHRIKDTNPWLDAQSKIKVLGRMSGQVLDTCTGLGYTAIMAARQADTVVTVEVDPAVLELARLNPWSGELVSNPRIRQIIGDIVQEVEGFGQDAFSFIIHDPPTMRLAGDLYAGDFYREVFRVLKPKGRLFHYIGDPSSKLGRTTARGVVRRLREAGFAKVTSNSLP